MRRLKINLLFLVTLPVFFSISLSQAQNIYAVNTKPVARYAVTGSVQADDKAEKNKLINVLKELNRIKGVYFMFSNHTLSTVTVNPVTDMLLDVETILSQMFKNTGLAYKKINAKTFVIISLNDASKTKAEIRNKGYALMVPTSNERVAKSSAHEYVITGKIVDKSGNPLAGVTVSVKGKNNGTSTDANGSFSIEASKGEVLIFTYVGYEMQEVTVRNSNNFSIQLAEKNGQLNEVVVTALGIRRERKSLGYSVTEVKGSELTQAREINVANSLVGRVAGLNVSSIAGGPGASTNVIIRGISSLGSTNQPLYVVNGVPMESAPNGQKGTQYDNGVDRGDAIGNLNPDDIESISVLKGAAASALYGYRAKAGVILITTKTGKGNGIEFNSNYVAEQIMDPTDWQYVYGQGSNNIKPVNQNAAFQAGQSSWGAKLDGSSVIQFDGVARPYTAQKNNLKNFYRTGGTFTNTIAFNKTFKDGALRLSANNLTNKAVIPNSGLNRQSFNFTGNFNPLKRLVIDARANYILEQAKNRPFLSDGAGNANFNVMILPTSVDVNVLKKTTNPDGTEYGYSANTYGTNPWFAANKFINNTTRERLIVSTSARYNFDNGFFVQGRAGRDAYNDRYTGVIPTGTAYRVNGQIAEQGIKFTDLNVDGLAGKIFKVSNNLTITPNIGASYRRTKSETITNNGADFAVPFVYNILNAKNKSVDYLVRDQETQSLYGTLEIAYNSYLYLTGSARSDWFSTLATPGTNNKLNVVYPSISGSFVFSEFVKNNWLSFGKIRAGYAVVGNATDPYQTQLSYTFNSASLNGLPLGSISNSTVPNKGLRPSTASELEIGTEMRLFKNKISVDITWYDKKSKNEIISAPASITSGYTGAVLNIGELQNKGVEALVSVTAIKTTHFSWVSSVNGSINHNKVLSLAAGQSQLPGGISRSGVGFTASVVGLPAAQVMAYDYKYDAAGKLVLDANGIPDRGDLIPLGSAYHKWIGGWNNEFSYKRINFSFLIDGKWGGKIFSATDFYGYIFGLHKATLVDREKNFGTTAAPIDAATYYGTFAGNISKVFVQDASFVKFRQLALGYTFPGTMFKNVVQSLNISFVARNLFTIMKKTDNIDPEANFSSTPGGLTQGLELGGVPPVRSFGVNLNVKF
ncbi:MAG: SusC/RagA family TonB-linked outer membrane protein [Ferruginibacter sp.]